jgi:hypothetical protein
MEFLAKSSSHLLPSSVQRRGSQGPGKAAP